jgi:RsiW-degrading membrane proteinase PrsW (M82 family)
MRASNPGHSILIYLMAGALGFACMENITYVFQYGAGGGVGGELFVLLLRVCMPIHVICSALQSINLCKMLLLEQRMSLLRILLPAICYHGFFDFSLFLMSAVQFAWDIESDGLGLASLVFGLLITIAGGLYAYRAVKDQQVISYRNASH